MRDRRFIIFGVLNEVIRRVHRYPIIKRSQRAQQTIIKGENFLEFSVVVDWCGAGAGGVAPLRSGELDGRKSCDQLCTQLGIGFEKLDQALKTDKEIVLVCK